jgi:hypothetical protein
MCLVQTKLDAVYRVKNVHVTYLDWGSSTFVTLWIWFLILIVFFFLVSCLEYEENKWGDWIFTGIDILENNWLFFSGILWGALLHLCADLPQTCIFPPLARSEWIYLQLPSYFFGRASASCWGFNPGRILYNGRRFGPPVTVKIIAPPTNPLLELSKAGRRVGSILCVEEQKR